MADETKITIRLDTLTTLLGIASEIGAARHHYNGAETSIEALLDSDPVAFYQDGLSEALADVAVQLAHEDSSPPEVEEEVRGAFPDGNVPI